VTRAPDLPGKWLAHCLHLDILTQGDSVEHAFAMAQEAVELAVLEDVAQGLDPLERAPAPEEEWRPLYDLLHDFVPLSEVPEDRRDAIDVAAGQISIHLPAQRRAESARPPAALMPDRVPEAWLLTALSNLRRPDSPRRA
jgi:predicted RNase H-like HicB family nuclease